MMNMLYEVPPGIALCWGVWSTRPGRDHVTTSTLNQLRPWLSWWVSSLMAELMSWGAHGAMRELKVPTGQLGHGCLAPFDLRSFGLGGPGHLPFAKLLATAWSPLALGHPGLVVPCSLLLITLFGSCPWSGFAAPWILVTWLLQSHM